MNNLFHFFGKGFQLFHFGRSTSFLFVYFYSHFVVKKVKKCTCPEPAFKQRACDKSKRKFINIAHLSFLGRVVSNFILQALQGKPITVIVMFTNHCYIYRQGGHSHLTHFEIDLNQNDLKIDPKPAQFLDCLVECPHLNLNPELFNRFSHC